MPGFLKTDDINKIGATVLHHFTVRDNFEIYLPTTRSQTQGLSELSQKINDLSAIITCIIDQNKKAYKDEPGQVVLNYLEKAENLRSWIDKVINEAYTRDWEEEVIVENEVVNDTEYAAQLVASEDLEEEEDELPVLEDLINVSKSQIQGWVIDHLKEVRPEDKEYITSVEDQIKAWRDYSSGHSTKINEAILDLIKDLTRERRFTDDEKADIELWLNELQIHENQIEEHLRQ